MSQELIGQIMARLQTEEERVIEKRARDGAAKDQNIEQSVTDEGIVQARADRVANLLFSNHRSRFERGFFKRRLTGKPTRLTEWYIDQFTPNYCAPVENWITDVAFNGVSAHHETGVRTLPISVEITSFEDKSFESGWQIGAVEKRGIQVPKRGVIDWEVLPQGPVRIWQHVREIGSGEEERKLVFDVDRKSGVVHTIAEGHYEDELLSLAKAAGSSALHLINQAILYLEK